MPLVMLGQLELQQKRYPNAIENLNRALKIEPQANVLYQTLADAYSAQGNAQAAQDARAKAGKTAPHWPIPSWPAYSLMNWQVSGTPLQQAQQLAALGRINAAREKLGEIFKVNPDDIDALALSARIEASMGNSAIAQAVAEQALKVKPDSGTAILARGLVYEFGGDDAHAYEFYQKAVSAEPKLADARLLLGNAEMRRGRYPQAIEQYRQLALLQPQRSPAPMRAWSLPKAPPMMRHALHDINAALAAQPKNGDLMQIFVRLASTCAAAKPEERDMALDYAQMLYKQHPTADDSSALALVLAAQGKFKEAQQYQAEAIFDAVRSGDSETAAVLKAAMQELFAQRKPERPWPANTLTSRRRC